MKHLVSVSTFCLALLFCVSAIPSHAATIEIEFNGATTGTTDVSLGAGSTFPGSADPVLGIEAVYNVSVIISGTPNSADNGTYTSSINLGETYCSTSAECTDISGSPTPNTGTLYVTGSLLGVNSTGFTGALVAITFSSVLTGTVSSNGENFSLNFPTGLTGITVNPTLLTALDIPSATTFSLAALTNVETGGGGSYTDAVSNSLEITTAASATPEPGTWVMMTLGISLIVFAVRKRSALVRQ
jgi:hypothetical protein